MNWALAAAAVLTGFGAVFHPAMAGRVLGPLADSDLPHTTKWLARLCWDGITLLFAVTALAFAAGAAVELSGWRADCSARSQFCAERRRCERAFRRGDTGQLAGHRCDPRPAGG